MTAHADHKHLLASLLADLSTDAPVEPVLDRHCHADCTWEVFYPFNTLAGNAAAASEFFVPLRASFPNHEHRPAFVIAGEFEGRALISSWGLMIGTFDKVWLGIPPTHGLVSQRIGINAVVERGKIAKAYVLLDIVDVMHQAGWYPFRAMPGTPQQWAFPPCDTGATARSWDGERGARTLAVVEEMQRGLPKPSEIAGLSTAPSRHSHHWHADMNWYGPAGIGSMRGQRGFRDFHGALFLQAFPDRTGYPRAAGGPEDAPGHYVRLGDGNYAVTGGWPSLHATHLGGEWLGLPPTGRHVEMRVADWYRLDENGRIVDNWVMMDVPHIVQQMGLDIFHDLAFRTDPSRERWPL